MAVDRRKLPKTVSARIENDIHQELLEKCNKVGCRVSDYVKASIEFCLHGSVEFDFGDVRDGNDDKPKEQPKAEHSPRIHVIERSDTTDNVPKVKVHLD
jgi:hypothetical protein